MKKICPYCGRIGTLGKSCEGCGYVLQIHDQSVPEEAEEAVAKAVMEAVETPLPQEDAMDQLYDALPDQDAVQTLEKTPDHSHTAFTRSARKLVAFLGWIFAIPVMAFGVVGIGGSLSCSDAVFLDSQDILSSVLLGLLFILVGLVIIHASHFRSFKRSWGRFLKYAVIFDFVTLFIVLLSM